MYHQQFSDLQVKVPAPKVPNIEFPQEDPATPTGRSVIKYELLSEMIWLPNLPVYFVSLDILHAKTSVQI